MRWYLLDNARHCLKEGYILPPLLQYLSASHPTYCDNYFDHPSTICFRSHIKLTSFPTFGLEEELIVSSIIYLPISISSPTSTYPRFSKATPHLHNHVFNTFQMPLGHLSNRRNRNQYGHPFSL
jgi:hypothetical protein